MKPDEIALLRLTLAVHRFKPYKGAPDEKVAAPFIEEIGAAIGVPHKRAWFLAEKWTDKRWWDYGVSVRGGWFEPRGIEVLTQDPRLTAALTPTEAAALALLGLQSGSIVSPASISSR